jgi:hypothetical protein
MSDIDNLKVQPVLECPHCKDYIIIEKINCAIFRHGVFINNNEQINEYNYQKLLSIRLPKDRFWPYTNSFQLMQISWLVSLVWACRISRKYFKTTMYAIVPFMFLIPMVMYDSSSYFPRHLVVINISFLASSLLMLFNAQKVQQSTLAKT